MSKFIEITENEKNTVVHSEQQTKILQVEKIITINPSDSPVVGGSEIETEPQSYNGVPDIRKVSGPPSEFPESISALENAPETVDLPVIAVGENYPSPGWTASNIIFNTSDIVEAQEYIGSGPSELEGGVDLVSMIDTNTSTATDGTYTNVPMSGGSGSGATAKVTVSGSAVTAIVVDADVVGYKVGDELTLAQGDITGNTDVVLTLTSAAITLDAYSVVRLAKYRDSKQVNYVLNLSYAELKTALNA